VGFVAGRAQLDVPKQIPRSVNLQGVEAVLGIDLFTQRWIAEGALRAFNQQEYSNSEVSLKEFDLRLVHQIPISRGIEARFGGGMSARYVSFSGLPSEVTGVSSEYSTPASVVLLGLQARFSHVIGLSADVSYRSRLINDTVDKGSMDGSIRLSGSF
jgi:hypothetical protein